MKHQNLNAFLHDDKKHGAFVFTSDSCELCAQFERDLSAYDTSSFTAVEVLKSEEHILDEMFKINCFPFTVVFVDNNVGLIKKGVLFQKQMAEVFEFLKKNNIKTESRVKAPVTQLEPVIIESPSRGDSELHDQYTRDIIKDCINRGEAPLCVHAYFDSILNENNPMERSCLVKIKEAWGDISAKTVVYTDCGVSDGMLEGITDAIARGRCIEFRALYEN